MRARYVAWGICISGVLAFSLLAWQIQGPESQVVRFDETVAAQAKLHAETHPTVLAFARAFTHVGAFAWMLGLSVLGSLVLIWLRQSRLAVVWLLLAVVGAGVNQAGKTIYSRPRPAEHLRDEAVYERNSSFPSGHAMGSIIGYGFICYAGWVLLRPRWAKVALAVLIAAVVLGIGWTRVYLRAHWCSDVLGGWSLGLAWLSLWYAMLRSSRS